jgi:hypothetical protein
MTPLDRLLQVLPPPSVPLLNSVDWSEVEARLGFTLPADYKAFIEHYGVGTIDGFMGVLHPTCENPNLRLDAQIEARLSALREMRADDTNLVPWLTTDNGDVCYWRTAGLPDEWTVVVHDAAIAIDESFSASMSQFLLDLLTRVVRSDAFPEDFPVATLFTSG